LPRDLSTKLPAKTVARLGLRFACRQPPKLRPNTTPKNTGARPLTPKHSGDLGMATKEPWKGRPAALGRVLLRLVMSFTGLEHA